MKLTHGIGLVLVAGAAVLAVYGSGGFNLSPTRVSDAGNSAFVPPAMGVPADRVGAGTRGVNPDSVGLHLMAPKGGGLTTLGTPILLWKLDTAFDGDIVVDLGPAFGQAEYSATLSGPFDIGYFGLDLNGSGAALETGKIYGWTVRLIAADTETVAAEKENLIERVDRPADMVSAAQSGLWFDAIHPVIAVNDSGQVEFVDRVRFRALAQSAGLSD